MVTMSHPKTKHGAKFELLLGRVSDWFSVVEPYCCIIMLLLFPAALCESWDEVGAILEEHNDIREQKTFNFKSRKCDADWCGSNYSFDRHQVLWVGLPQAQKRTDKIMNKINNKKNSSFKWID